LSLQP